VLLIREVSTRGFGCLKGGLKFSPGLNVVVGDNERGKSTLQALITSIMYGFEPVRGRASKDEPIRPIERYRPWDGGPYDGTLVVESNKGGAPDAYRLSRDFGERPDASSFRMERMSDGREVAAAEIASERGPVSPGEWLTGMEESLFAASAVVRQNRLSDASAESGRASIRDGLERIISGPSATVREALVRLEQRERVEPSLKSGDRIKIQTDIDRLRQDKENLEKALREMEGFRRKYEEEIDELDTLARQVEDLDAKRTAVASLRIAAEAKEVAKRLDLAAKFEATIAHARKWLEQNADAAAYPSGGKEALAAAKATIDERAARVNELCSSLAVAKRACDAAEADLRANFSTLMHLSRVQCDEADALLGRVLTERRNVAWAKEKWEKTRQNINAMEEMRLSELEARYPDGPLRTKLAEYWPKRQAMVADMTRLDANEARMEALVMRRARRWYLPIALCVVMAILFAFGTIVHLWPIQALGGICLVIVVALVWANLSHLEVLEEDVRDLGVKPDANLKEAIEKTRAEKFRIKEQVKQHDAYLAAETTASLPNIEFTRALKEAEDLAALQRKYLPQLQAKYSLDRAEEGLTKTLAEVEPPLAALRLLSPAGRLAEGEERTLMERVHAYRAALAELASAQEKHDRVKKDHDRAEADLAEAETALRGILRRAGIEDGAVDDGIKEYERRVEQRGEYDRCIETVKVYTQRLAEETGGDVEKLRARRSELEAEVARVKPADLPEYAGYDAVQLEKAHASLTTRIEDTRKARQTVLVSLAKASVELDRTPELRARLEWCMRRINERERELSILELARGMLEEVGANAHRMWGEVLNRRASAYVSALTGNAYSNLRFAPSDLTFTVERAGLNRTLSQDEVEHVLSEGARDAILLGLRLAVVDHLAGGAQAVPLIFDEPLADLDDARFDEALSLLSQVAATHQVVVLSCHAAQYEAALKRLNLKDANFVRLGEAAREASASAPQTIAGRIAQAFKPQRASEAPPK
jgi:hypothetical protein